jgi:hypothetical protein
MKKPIIASIVIMAITSFTFAQAQNVVYETTYLKPKTDKLKELGEKMKAHNQKYHAEAPYEASAWQVLTGERSGYIAWLMGPFTFTDLDSRPSEGGHDDDWMGGVMPLTHGLKDGGYWKMMTDYAYMPSEDFVGKVMRVRSFDIKRDKWDEFLHIMTMIMKVYNERNLGNSFALLDNWSNDEEVDAIIVWQYENYAYFDSDLDFPKKYEEVHGDNSWHQFIEAIDEIVISTSDELLERMAD